MKQFIGIVLHLEVPLLSLTMFGAEFTHFDFSRGLFCEAAACTLTQLYGKFLFCEVLAEIPEDLGQISALVNVIGELWCGIIL